ncbi:hypothetical protein BMY_1282 [Wohlfahrtiimonas chitiniclastica]|nr:hypothetical protein BMY_1282 [Wohlfahrtiimonas chitiniclastica]
MNMGNVMAMPAPMARSHGNERSLTAMASRIIAESLSFIVALMRH